MHGLWYNENAIATSWTGCKQGLSEYYANKVAKF